MESRTIHEGWDPNGIVPEELIPAHQKSGDFDCNSYDSSNLIDDQGCGLEDLVG